MQVYDPNAIEWPAPELRVRRIHPDATLPTRAHRSAGHDLTTVEAIVLGVGKRHLVRTGLELAIPRNHYGRVAERSGLSWKAGLGVMAGVIDEDYRGEVGVILVNLGEEPVTINVGDRVAQLIVEKIAKPEVVEVFQPLDATERGTNGFGSTGVRGAPPAAAAEA